MIPLEALVLMYCRLLNNESYQGSSMKTLKAACCWSFWVSSFESGLANQRLTWKHNTHFKHTKTAQNGFRKIVERLFTKYLQLHDEFTIVGQALKCRRDYCRLSMRGLIDQPRTNWAIIMIHLNSRESRVGEILVKEWPPCLSIVNIPIHSIRPLWLLYITPNLKKQEINVLWYHQMTSVMHCHHPLMDR